MFSFFEKSNRSAELSEPTKGESLAESYRNKLKNVPNIPDMAYEANFTTSTRRRRRKIGRTLH